MKKFRPKPINQQTLVITGASSGIGLATARMAAKKGARVVLSSRNLEAIEKIADELELEGGRVVAVKADVREYDELVRLRDRALAAFGSIDTWINNAGTSIFGQILEIPLEDERKLFDVNFWGVRHGCHVAVEAMREKGGVLINIGSEASTRGLPVQAMYSASKHAVKAYTEALRVELQREKVPIAVSLVLPTSINTPFAEHAKNYLKHGEPSLPTPTYHPDVVATAILNCAEHPQRDVYVGVNARLTEIMEPFFARVLDRYMERSMYDQQTKGTKLPHEKEQEALDHVPKSEGEVLGGNRGKMHRLSMYTSASQHPWRTAVLIGVLVVILSTFAVTG